ncbi:prolyl oligopeptidase family serine peptidase [Brevibacterium sp.]|uniref:prolyl oligopeptidase family serine peptidase n=1 Tax=Brevibacterium sp. TaxID=1701 RepID=UPI0025B95125|nr:prolyl oligopeptidase family serine peptidase [Brevibacterium sp.]
MSAHTEGRGGPEQDPGVRIVPYGSWESPIDEEVVSTWSATVGQGRFGAVAGRPGVWFTQRPADSGAAGSRTVSSGPADSGVAGAGTAGADAARSGARGTALFWTSLVDHTAPIRLTPAGMDVGSALRVVAAGPPTAGAGAATPVCGAPAAEAGGEWAVMPGTGDVVWVDAGTQRLRALSGSAIEEHVRTGVPLPIPLLLPDGASAPHCEEPRPGSAERPGPFRYGDLTVTQGVLLAVREDPRAGSVAVVRLDPTGTHPPQFLVEAPTRFVAWPRLSPDRSLLLFAGWDPPRTPWEETALFAASLSHLPASATHAPRPPVSLPPEPEFPPAHARQIWRHPDATALQPEWVSGRSIVFTEDSRATWRPVLMDAKAAFARASGEPGVPLADAVPLLPDEAIREALADEERRLRRTDSAPELPPLLGEDGVGGPLRSLGERWFLPAGGGRRLLAQWRNGTAALLWAYPETGDVRAIGSDLDWLRLQDLDEERGLALVTGGGGRRADGLYLCSLVSGELVPLVLEAAPGSLSPWVPLPFADTVGGVPVVIYPPRSGDHRAPADTAPPFVVRAHDHPADQAVPRVHPQIAYLTSRGMGVAVVNGTGSSGFGRAYRDDLRGFEGEREVQDLLAVARGLAAEGRADADRIAVWGARLGGVAALRALADPDTPFACGVVQEAAPAAEAPAGEGPQRPVALLWGEAGAASAETAHALAADLRRAGLPFSLHFLAQGSAPDAAAVTYGYAFCAAIMGFSAAPGSVRSVLQGRGRGGAGGAAAAHG